MIKRSSLSKPLALAAAGAALALTLAGCAGGAPSGGSSDKVTGKTMTFVTDQGGPAGAKYSELLK